MQDFHQFKIFNEKSQNTISQLTSRHSSFLSPWGYASIKRLATPVLKHFKRETKQRKEF
jgi:hypothetical protein